MFRKNAKTERPITQELADEELALVTGGAATLLLPYFEVSLQPTEYRPSEQRFFITNELGS